MNKAQLIKKVVKKTGVSLPEAKHVVNTVLQLLAQKIKAEDGVRIRNFGIFKIVSISERIRYNISSHMMEMFPQRERITFLPSKSLLKRLQSKSLSNEEYVTVKLSSKSILSTSDSLSKYRTDRRISKTSDFYTPKSTLIFRSGIKIDYVKPNIGKRVRVENTIEYGGLTYCGNTTYNYFKGVDTEDYTYPTLLIPFFNTPILEFRKNRYGTEGVMEPILVDSLNTLKIIEPQIDIVRNISLPIKNRNYGYRPDVGVIWKEKNIFIDIEIDEPYDIVSRKPIHYKGGNDRLRNDYFLDNGWVVIRFTEKQIVENCEEVNNFVKFVLWVLSGDNRFKSENRLEEVNRWSYEDALKWEGERYREVYLGIEGIVQEINSRENVCPQSEFSIASLKNTDKEIFEKPMKDIICDRYEGIRNEICLECKKGRYIVFRIKNKGYEYIADSEKVYFKQKGNSYGIEIDDLIEEKQYFLRFQELSSFKSINSLTKYQAKDGDDWDKLLAEAILYSNPIEIEYDTADSGVSRKRKILFLTFWYDLFNLDEYKRKYSDMQLLEITAGWKYNTLAKCHSIGYIVGFCMYRKSLRTFYIPRIKGGRIFNCVKNLYKIKDVDLWNVLDNQTPKPSIAINMYAELDEDERNCGCLGNYAHALVIDDRFDEALEEYLKIEPDSIVPYSDITWKMACNTDFDEFISKNIKKDNFQIIRKMLKDQGW